MTDISSKIMYFTLAVWTLWVAYPTQVHGTDYVQFQLKNGQSYEAVVDSVLWWGLKFQDKQVVMYKQLSFLVTPSETLSARIKDAQPAAEVETRQHNFVVRFEGVTNLTEPVNSSRFFRRSYLLGNYLTETGEQFEFQLYSVPEDAPYLIVMIATSAGLTHKKPSSYTGEVTLPTENDIRHMILGYTFGLGYRHAFSRGDFSVMPAFSKKLDAITQDEFIVDEVSDVAFLVDMKYRYMFNTGLVLAAGGRVYLNSIPVQGIEPSLQMNIGIGWAFPF